MTTFTPHIRLGALLRHVPILVLPALVGGFCASALTGMPGALSAPAPAHVRSAGAAAASYGYPVKPFHREHPIRGYLGDPRIAFAGPPTRRSLLAGGVKTASFHQGVDISAPDGTAVYPVVSGTVTTTTGDWVGVTSGASRFEYWHIRPLVSVGQHVTAYSTVLGRIIHDCQHVHLTEYQDGHVVNPLRPGGIGPYHDGTAPHVSAIILRSAADGSELLPGFVRGRVDFVVDAYDLPTLRVAGIWTRMPTTPAVLTWSIRRWPRKVVVPTRVAYDFRSGIPANGSFWRVYARGTYQNMEVFGKHYSYLQPGDYQFRLAPTAFDTRGLRDGVYELVVTAGDTRGNTSSMMRRFTIHNAPGWWGS